MFTTSQRDINRDETVSKNVYVSKRGVAAINVIRGQKIVCNYFLARITKSRLQWEKRNLEQKSNNMNQRLTRMLINAQQDCKVEKPFRVVKP